LRQAKFGHGWFLPGPIVLRAGIGIMTIGLHFAAEKRFWSMIRKSGNRFSEKITLNQRDAILMRHRIMI
jgi:hypothetical protein